MAELVKVWEPAFLGSPAGLRPFTSGLPLGLYNGIRSQILAFGHDMYGAASACTSKDKLATETCVRICAYYIYCVTMS